MAGAALAFLRVCEDFMDVGSKPGRLSLTYPANLLYNGVFGHGLLLQQPSGVQMMGH